MFTFPTKSSEREMTRSGGKTVHGSQLRKERFKKLDGNVDGGTALVAGQVLMLFASGQVNHSGAMAKMNVAGNPEPLQHFHRPIDR